MPPLRAFSFPLSHVEEVSRTSPFFVRNADAAQLTSCEAFNSIRSSLSIHQHDVCFCEPHLPTTDDQREAWLLHRDITYALIFPLLEVHRRATQLATSMLGDRPIFDLELIFRGDARGAFAWLQCFIAEEEEWCSAQGCPACVVSYVLQAEPTIRLVLTVCRLAQSLRRYNETPAHLPVFDFWLETLRHALDDDDFWGPEFWAEIEPRASNLEKGIYQMARQCCELEKLTPNDSASETCDKPPMTSSQDKPTRIGTIRKMRAKAIFTTDESRWMQKIVLGCWTTVLADASEQQRRASAPRPSATSSTTRSLSS